jgi:hypothetical protein
MTLLALRPVASPSNNLSANDGIFRRARITRCKPPFSARVANVASWAQMMAFFGARASPDANRHFQRASPMLQLSYWKQAG